MSNWDKVQRQAEIRRVNKFSAIQRFTGHTERWRRLVLSRDRFKCVLCGSTENLQAHHIDRWYDSPTKRLKVNNGATLCSACHTKYHQATGHVFPESITRELKFIVSRSSHALIATELENDRAISSKTFLIKKANR